MGSCYICNKTGIRYCGSENICDHWMTEGQTCIDCPGTKQGECDGKANGLAEEDYQ